MWVGSQCGGCVSMAGDGVSGWRVETWRTCAGREWVGLMGGACCLVAHIVKKAACVHA